MNRVTAVLSMLHEPLGRAGSATRRFRGEPVLAWTLRRLAQTRGITSTTILCWHDQLSDVEPIASEHKAYVSMRRPRTAVPQIEAVAAARRWADGWRGGLLGSCEFDRGFYGPWIHEIRHQTEADGVLLIDPSAGLVDPILVDGVIDRAKRCPDAELCFSQAAPGLCGALLRPSLLERLATTRIHPGSLLSYRPDSPRHDPLGDQNCASVPTLAARTLHRFTLDSQRQIARASAATESLNGELICTPAEGLVAVFDAAGGIDPLPREVVVELNTNRATDPIFWPGSRLKIERPAMELATAEKLFAELAALDDVRVLLAGVGDPLLHERLLDIVAAAHAAGVHTVAVETDFLGVTADRIEALAESRVDVVSVHLPAISQGTYQAIMGVDAFSQVMANIKLFVEKRQAKGRGVPLLAPTFVKCGRNQAEMELWYDHWIRTLNCAVITGPSDYGGLIPDVAAADMTPPRRRACQRLTGRMTVHSDGTVVSCEQDVLARQIVGKIGESASQAWNRVGSLRADHRGGQWNRHPTCETCREWHRG